MRLRRIPGMPARCSAFLTRIFKLRFRLRRVTAPFTNSTIFSICWRLHAAKRHSEGWLAALLTASQNDKASRHIGCLVRQQPDDSLRHFFRRTASLHRYQLPDPIDPPRLSPISVHIGIDKAGPNRVDTNALCRHLQREPGGKGVNGAFRRRVIQIFMGCTEP